MTAAQWLAEYGASHQNPTNKLIHYICVPAIYWSVMAILWALPEPNALQTLPAFNWAVVAVVLIQLYYFMLSPKLALVALPFNLVMLWLCAVVDSSGWSLVWTAITVFVLAWIGQFIGHQVEGKKPSFLKDVQFLLIGPLWLVANLIGEVKR